MQARMDVKRFDAWTRRRFGLGAGVLAASLFGFQGLDEAEDNLTGSIVRFGQVRHFAPDLLPLD